jgi:hypothetical protein
VRCGRGDARGKKASVLSNDEIDQGMTFILKLSDGPGTPSMYWVGTLRGDAARRWYGVYRSSDWATLRAEAAGVFRRGVTGEEAERIRTSRHRCVYIQTDVVRTGELARADASPAGA